MRDIKRQCTASWESVGTERGSLQGPHLADQRIVLKRTFREEARGAPKRAREKEREREMKEHSRRSKILLVPRE